MRAAWKLRNKRPKVVPRKKDGWGRLEILKMAVLFIYFGFYVRFRLPLRGSWVWFKTQPIAQPPPSIPNTYTHSDYPGSENKRKHGCSRPHCLCVLRIVLRRLIKINNCTINPEVETYSRRPHINKGLAIRLLFLLFFIYFLLFRWCDNVRNNNSKRHRSNVVSGKTTAFAL